MSMDSIPMSQFDMLATPLPTTDTGYPNEAGAANNDAASLNSNGVAPSGKSQAQSISGRSGKSLGNGIGKKLSMIKENPLSRNTTPLRSIEQQGDNRGQLSRSPHLYKRPSALDDRRSMRSGRSAGSRMVAVNPDPESPDMNGQAQGQSQPLQIYSQPPPPEGSLRHHPGANFPPVIPLGTKKSGLSTASEGGPLETPTPMPRMSKGKGKELVPPEASRSDSSGINITIQTPSDPGRTTPRADYFLPSKPPSRLDIPSHSTPRLTPSNALSANQVHGGVRHSTPKIFQAQKLPEEGPNEEDDFIPRMTIRKRIGPDGVYTVNNAGMTPGLVLHQPLPSRVPQFQQGAAGGHAPVTGNLGAELGRELHRTGSDSSLRSQGAYGKFDPDTYKDPALLWAGNAPPGAFGRPRSDTSSKRISYADPR
ncbi:hypothetical protein AGABI1DRAFT_119725 [Agaricus bisporus var. burnettii JB137-S8]|uniref:Uncharacterized protein n=1 Tax=Agaricus bisporus var. burnettii (strain JB137-S8 / ATCC MYA-4627 / FGSC 10392) TaxID=597362 RepID=K5X0A5_AGABU|nr:uncharacterized protein AGABI1DRAFT_119725 [Agaricus bisporus var. burnettii JB137-S8]EKM81216.1 hypothetical protein AGABI1DRAFT_119725 [Agaricus bisporus var. burnettii JB137-S8]